MFFVQIESNESKNKHKSRSVQKIQEMIIAESLSNGILIGEIRYFTPLIPVLWYAMYRIY